MAKDKQAQKPETAENTAQEVQKDTVQDATLIEAAAKITGKPAAEISTQEAQDVLFSEIGSNEKPPANKEKAMQAAADAIRAQDAQEDTEAIKRGREAVKEYLQQHYTPEQIEQAHRAAAMQRAAENWIFNPTAAQKEAMKEAKTMPEFWAQQQAFIKSLPEYDPALDRNDPAFNEAAYKQAAEINDFAEQATRIIAEMQATKTDITGQTADALTALSQAGLDGIAENARIAREQFTAIVAGALDALTTARDAAQAIVQSDTFKALKQTFSNLSEYMRENAGTIAEAAEAARQLTELEPFLEAELAAQQEKHPELKDMTIDEFLADIDENGEPVKSIWTQIIEGAKDRKARSDANKEAAQKAGAAAKSGAITTIGERLFIPTLKQYQNAFITTDNPAAKAGLFRVENDNETGTGKRYLAINIDIPFLQGLAKSVYLDALNGGNGEIEIYFPTLAKELGLNLSKYNDTEGRTEARTAYILNTIKEIETVWGVLPGTIDDTVYRLISVYAYNPTTEVLTFTSPYLRKLINDNMTLEQKQIEGGKKFAPWQCDLLHSTAVAERNKAAVEMATRILVGVQQRGTTPDAKLAGNKKKHYKDEQAVTYKITCRGLIQDCPQIRERLKAQKKTSNKTVTLQRAFAAMYRILKKKSDLFTYYKDLHIKEISPTMSTLDAFITVTHHGQNTEYNRPALPLKEITTAPPEQADPAAE